MMNRRVVLYSIGLIACGLWLSYGTDSVKTNPPSTKDLLAISAERNNSKPLNPNDRCPVECHPCQEILSTLEPMPTPASNAASVVGSWSSVINLPIAPIHLHLLPNSKVLGWSGYTYPNLATSEYIIWDPANPNATLSAAVPPSNINNLFCSGHSFLPDGRLLITGGQNGANLTEGIPDATIYDYKAQTWTRVPNMNKGRWYPTNVSLSNGEQLTLSGGYVVPAPSPSPVNFTNNEVELYRPGSATWRLYNPSVLDYPIAVGLYPWSYLSPDSRVFLAGPATQTYFLDLIGNGGRVNGPLNTNGLFRDSGSSVMYANGKILVGGGGYVPSSNNHPSKTAQTIDLNQANPQWSPTGDMKIERRQHNAVVLPNGEVLVVGGTRSNCHSDDRAGAAVLSAELWKPGTGVWTLMAAMAKPRLYHSAALLLPDGRVVAAGGSWYSNTAYCGLQCNINDVQANLEIYSPPYLYDANNQLAARPAITQAPPSIKYKSSFFVQTPNASSISKVSLIRLSSVTHSYNQDQHFNSLDFSVVSGGLNVIAPATGRVTPPGFYMLFIVNSSGVPSVASIVQLTDKDAGLRFDYDGEWRTNLAVWRPSTGYWSVQFDTTNPGTPSVQQTQWGLNGDQIAPGDYDGDGKTDHAVFRPSNSEWSILKSSTGGISYAVYGLGTDLPVSADYDGDTKTDIAIWRPSTGEWAVLKSSTGLSESYFFGMNGDKPVLGDYDADGKADFAVFRPSNGYWYIRKSSDGTIIYQQFGLSGDKPTPADYDGDGKTDIAVFRPSNAEWSIIKSSNWGVVITYFGLNGDIPVPGDYDADGKADIAIWRPTTGEWAVLRSKTGTFQSQTYGLNGDVPVPSAYIR